MTGGYLHHCAGGSMLVNKLKIAQEEAKIDRGVHPMSNLKRENSPTGVYTAKRGWRILSWFGIKQNRIEAFRSNNEAIRTAEGFCSSVDGEDSGENRLRECRKSGNVPTEKQVEEVQHNSPHSAQGGVVSDQQGQGEDKSSNENDIEHLTKWLDAHITSQWHPGPIQIIILFALLVLGIAKMVSLVIWLIG